MRLDPHTLRAEYHARLAAGDTPTEARAWARDVAQFTVTYRWRCYARFR